mmetsp:Transcript_19111/g.50234  ORF Transcript_19111/g.50234 Transcript_19111/m.50234 type:complete len:213 (-) Transcript_19111:1270-1908(-)
MVSVRYERSKPASHSSIAPMLSVTGTPSMAVTTSSGRRPARAESELGATETTRLAWSSRKPVFSPAGVSSTRARARPSAGARRTLSVRVSATSEAPASQSSMAVALSKPTGTPSTSSSTSPTCSPACSAGDASFTATTVESSVSRKPADSPAPTATWSSCVPSSPPRSYASGIVPSRWTRSVRVGLMAPSGLAHIRTAELAGPTGSPSTMST